MYKYLFLMMLIPNIGFSELKLAPVFSNNMVLQRDVKLPIYGKADPGEKITVKFIDQEVSGNADAD